MCEYNNGGVVTITRSKEHPAWGILGYRCKCGLIYENQRALYYHVLKIHDQRTAYDILSWRQYERYCDKKSLDRDISGRKEVKTSER